METLASFFRVYEVINREVLTKLRVQTRTSIALIIYGTTRVWRVENLVTHGITDKAPYLSEVIALRLLFLSLLLVSLHYNQARPRNPAISQHRLAPETILLHTTILFRCCSCNGTVTHNIMLRVTVN